jgi:hypothetical protein
MVIAFIYVILFFFIKNKIDDSTDVDLSSPSENDILFEIAIVIIFFILVMLAIKGMVWLGMNTSLVKVLINSMSGLIVIGVMGMIYLLMKTKIDKAKDTNKKSILSLLLKIVMFLPCLLIDMVDYIKYEFNLTTKPIWILVGVESVFIGIWFLLPLLFDQISNLNGLKLVNAPVSMNKEYTIGNYKQLHEKRILFAEKNYETNNDTNQIINTSSNSCDTMDISGNVTAECANSIWKEYGCLTNISATGNSGKFMLTGSKDSQSFDLSNKSLDDVKNYIGLSVSKHPDSCTTTGDNTDVDLGKNSLPDPNVPKNKYLAWIYNQVKNIPIIKVKFSTHPQYTDTNKRRFRYTYSISGWFYINPQPPSTRSAYNTYTNILKYGNNVNVEYNGKLGSLRVMTNKGAKIDKNTGTSTSAKQKNESVQIYETTDVLYQKWNNIVINYDDGYMDIFINGALVGSKSGITPYMTTDNIISGADNGLFGGICNVVYYEKVLKRSEIVFNYKALRDNTFPYLGNGDNNFIQQQPETNNNTSIINKLMIFLGIK